jgi:hypothetical protein
MKTDEIKVNSAEENLENTFVIPDEAYCSPEFPEGCKFAE